MLPTLHLKAMPKMWKRKKRQILILAVETERIDNDDWLLRLAALRRSSRTGSSTLAAMMVVGKTLCNRKAHMYMLIKGLTLLTCDDDMRFGSRIRQDICLFVCITITPRSLLINPCNHSLCPHAVVHFGWLCSYPDFAAGPSYIDT